MQVNAPAHDTPLQPGDWLVRLAVPLYIAFGAVAKLTTGQPLQLPLISLRPDPSAAAERAAAAALPLLCAAELLVAGVIAFGPRWSRWLAITVLSVFAAVLVLHVRAQAESCGCFGAVAASPALMLTIAVSGVLLIALLPFSGRPIVRRPGRWLVRWTAASLAAVVVVSLAQLPERAGWRVPVVRLRPAEWVGLPLQDAPFYPLLEGLSTPAPPFAEAEQTWVLWLRTCPHCHEYFHERWSTPTDRRIVAVEIPLSARGIGDEPHPIDCPSCVRLHLRAGRLYAPSATPIIVIVRNGRIVDARANPPSTSWEPK